MGVRTRLAGALFAAVVVTRWSAGTAGAPEDRQFVVAVDEGASLLPIARYDGHGWVNTWPQPEDIDAPVPALARVPTSWLARNVPLDWMVWFSTGGSSGVHVVGLERSGGCLASPTLKIESIPQPPSDLYDVMHVGLATTDGVPVEAVRRLRRTDAEWHKLEPQIKRIFLAAERRAVDDYRGDYGDMRERLSLNRMEHVPVTLDWLYRSTTGARSYYFEAAKRASGSPRLRIGVGGWLIEEANGRLQSVGVTGQPHWDEDVLNDPIGNVSDLIPLGILRISGRVLWVVEVPTDESGSFSVYDVAAAGVRTVLTTDAGGC